MYWRICVVNQWIRTHTLLSGLAVMLAIASFFTPEIRRLLGLESRDIPPSQPSPSTPYSSSPNWRTPGSSHAAHHPRSATPSDYAALQQSLSAGDWRTADQDTRRLLLKLTGREQDVWVDEASLKQLPCETLQTIDTLWQSASQKRFGFGIQYNQWMASGKNLDEMSDRVGWRNAGMWVSYDRLNFSLEAVPGHLPSGDGIGLWLDGMRVGRGFPLLAPELQRCGITGA